ncbi:MAG: hypothetical protein IKD35_01930, partial [Clostridia bacterium]|nr:hypothetical protein [Clostridia bacterium]
NTPKSTLQIYPNAFLSANSTKPCLTAHNFTSFHSKNNHIAPITCDFTPNARNLTPKTPFLISLSKNTIAYRHATAIQSTI